MDEEVKKEIANTGIKEASKILIHTMNFIEVENFITGTVIDYLTGVAYELKFERKILNGDTVSVANRTIDLIDKLKQHPEIRIPYDSKIVADWLLNQL